MTPLFPAQRAAEEFDQVLGGTAPPAAADRYADLLETVDGPAHAARGAPRAEFVGDLRSRLMTAAETELVAAPAGVRQLTPTRPPRTAPPVGTVAASLVIVGGTAGMAAAAYGALPGEGLYPIKRGVEHAETVAHLGDASKGKAMLDQAGTRLDEVRSLQAQGSPDSALIASTIDSFSSSADAGSAKLFKAYQAERRHQGHHHGPRPSPPSRWPRSPRCPARPPPPTHPWSTPPTPSPTSTSRRGCCAGRAARPRPSTAGGPVRGGRQGHRREPARPSRGPGERRHQEGRGSLCGRARRPQGGRREAGRQGGPDRPPTRWWQRPPRPPAAHG